MKYSNTDLVILVALSIAMIPCFSFMRWEHDWLWLDFFRLQSQHLKSVWSVITNSLMQTYADVVVTSYSLQKTPLSCPISIFPEQSICPTNDLGHVTRGLLNNAIWFFLFGIQHTLTAQEVTHNFLINRVGVKPKYLRALFIIITGIWVGFIRAVWYESNLYVWNFNGLPLWTMTIFFIVHELSLLCFLYLMYIFDAPTFFGFSQILDTKEDRLGNPQPEPKEKESLMTTSVFSWCRHPMYLCSLCGMLITPLMTLDRFVLCLCAFIYLLGAVPIEEKKLEAKYGQAYLEYKKRVSAVIPYIW